MNKSLIALSISVLMVGLSVGCVAVPKTTATLDLRSGTAKITSPKDGNLQGLHVIYNGTNGQTTVDLGASGYNNNPNVISSTAAGQVSVQDSYINGILGGMNIAAKYFSGQGGGAGFLPAVSTANNTATAAPAGAVTPPATLSLASNVLWLPATDLHTAPPIPAGWRMADNFNGVFCLSGDTNKCFIAIQPAK